MNIRDLEEWQGVTRDLFRAWLTKSGWKELETVRPGCVKWAHWSGTCLGTISDGRLAASIECVAIHYRRSIQSILREINPRLIMGPPSLDLIVAHGGCWLAMKPMAGCSPLINMWDRRQIEHFVTGDYLLHDWSFWPCDAAGNKVPMPVVKK